MLAYCLYDFILGYCFKWIIIEIKRGGSMFLQDKNKDSFLKKTSEQIEDRVDEAIFEEAYEEYLKNGKKSRPVSELWKEAGI